MSLEGTTMKSKFVEEVRTVNINEVINGSLSNNAYMSVKPWNGGSAIDLVIGAKWENSVACAFSKNHLQELINVLTEIHAVMKD
jgi:hypothetical protein